MRFLMVLVSALVLATSLVATQKVIFQSQANQDELVIALLYDLLGKEGAGYYLEIGSGDPIEISNSYVLEKNYGWRGISIDISLNFLARWYLNRSNPLLFADATQLDYGSTLEALPQVIDYLSLDIDGLYDEVLRKVMVSKRIFKIITIEHDAYRYGDTYRSKEREILTEQGYHLLCGDVAFSGTVFEDWWIHPGYFPPSFLEQVTSHNLQGKESSEIIQKIKAIIEARALSSSPLDK